LDEVAPSKPSTGPPGTLLSYPDELWATRLSEASPAFIGHKSRLLMYWLWRKKLYSTHQLSSSDGHTIE
jgi:hypothetical protein